MALDTLESLTLYANPPTNILGTTLFLSYILVALYCTFSITTSLYRKYTAVKPTLSPQNASHIRTLSLFALASFTSLSYHMLKFLLISYARWNMNRSFFGTTAVTGQEHGNEGLAGGLMGSVWHWMLNSTLFESFAKELVDDAPSSLVTQMALLGTWFWGVWIAGTASKRRLSKGSMIQYLLLSQILPISFTASLFLLDTELSRGVESGKKEDGKVEKKIPERKGVNRANSSAARTPKQQAAARSKAKTKLSFILRTVIFNLALLVLPSSKPSPWFIPAVLATRAMLLLPHFSDTKLGRDDDWFTCLALSFGFVVANYAVVAKAGNANVLGIAGALWRGSEAVKSLGWDGVVAGGLGGWYALS